MLARSTDAAVTRRAPGMVAPRTGEPARQASTRGEDGRAGSGGPEPRCTLERTSIRIDVAHFAERPEAHRDGSCGRDRNCAACAALSELCRVREDCARGGNAALRLHWRVDSTTVDRLRVAEGRSPVGKAEWAPDPAVVASALDEIAPGLARKAILERAARGSLYTYPLVRAVAPSLAGTVAASVAWLAFERWRAERFDVLVRQRRPPPGFVAGSMPIPLRGHDIRITAPARGEEAIQIHGFGVVRILGFRLRAGRSPRGGKAGLPFRAVDAVQDRHLGDIVLGRVRLGDGLLTQDRRRSGVWHLVCPLLGGKP